MGAEYAHGADGIYHYMLRPMELSRANRDRQLSSIGEIYFVMLVRYLFGGKSAMCITVALNEGVLCTSTE